MHALKSPVITNKTKKDKIATLSVGMASLNYHAVRLNAHQGRHVTDRP